MKEECDAMALIACYLFKVETLRRRMTDIERETWGDRERITMAIGAMF